MPSSYRIKCIILITLGTLSILSLLTSNHVLIKSTNRIKLNNIKPITNNGLNEVNLIQEKPSSVSRSGVKLGYKLFHLDLKGSPPKLSYLKSLLRDLNATGCNGILLEYEDMFPFSGQLVNISHRNHYTKEHIKQFLILTQKYQFEIIPLIQTFGHLEFILKLQQFQSLREVNAFPQEICPKLNQSVHVVHLLLDQVLDFHRSILKNELKYVHIGCDEVYHLGLCPRCTGTDPKEIFTSHVISIAKYVRSKHNLIPIIWDDMLRKFYEDELKNSKLGQYVELMVWDYTENVDHLVSPFLWPMYAQSFTHIWAASAFKGAFGESLYQVQALRHSLNQISWLEVLDREGWRISNLRGIAVTGWSRYDHFAVLCELLPVAVPSLYASFLILDNNSRIAERLSELLNCPGGPWTTYAGVLTNLESCSWPGHDLHLQMTTLKYYSDSIGELLSTWSENKGWLTSYNVEFNETATWRLEEPKNIAKNYLQNILGHVNDVNLTMIKYYPQYVINEFIAQKIQPLVKRLNIFLNHIHVLQTVTVWKTRPIF